MTKDLFIKIKNFFKNYYALIIPISICSLFFITANISSYSFPDEVSFLYNCKTLAESGTSAFGDKWPLYFNTWLVGGHSPLPLYIASLFVKIFGVKLLAIRFAQFIVFIISVFFAYKIFNLLFENKLYSNIVTIVYGLSCQLSFFSGFFMDCAWTNVFLCISLYYFIYAIKQNKHYLLIISTISACLGFYCYGLSILFIPVLLASLYISFIVSKQLKIKDAILNFIVAIIVSIPFILFGLVTLGIIKPGVYLGFTIPDMSLYCRNNFYIGFSILNLIRVPFYSFVYSFVTSFFAVSSQTNSNVLHATITTSIIVLLIIYLILTNKKPHRTFKTFGSFTKYIYLSVLISFLTYCALMKNTTFETAYRNSSCSILYAICISPIAISLLYNSNKKVLLSIALAFSTCCFISLSTHNIAENDTITYYIQENSIKHIDIYTTYPETSSTEEENNYEQAWWSYKFRLDIPDDEYGNFKEEQIERYRGGNTVQVSDRLKTTIHYKDVDKTHYLFVLDKDKKYEDEGRKFIKEFEYADSKNNSYYLYSPVN